MRQVLFLFITFICAASACQKQSSTNKTISTMDVDQKHTSPLADTFQLAEDLLIPYRTKDSLFGYVNRSGEMVIEPQWIMATPFANGRAAVLVQFSKWQQAAAMIDREGNLITEYTYTRIAPSGHPGRWQVQILGGQWGIIDSMGNEIIPIGFERMGYVKGLGWYLAKLDGKLGYIDDTGKIMLPFQYERLEYIDKDPDFPHFWCKKDGRYLYLDKDLNQFIEETFEYAGAFYYGLAWIEEGDHNFMINLEGERILDMSKYHGLTYGHPTIGSAMKGKYPDSQHGLVNLLSGEEISPFKFSGIEEFHNGHAVASIKDKDSDNTLVGIINEKGEWTVEPKYGSIHYYNNNQFFAIYEEEEMASELISSDGEILFQSEYYISVFFNLKNNDIFLKLEDLSTDPTTKGVIDYMGNEILPPLKYTETSDDAFGDNGLMQVRENGIYYYVDIHGNEYIEK